uniref:Helicase C-terminal domain-containing protein n=1 Tax=Ganoderma boninense TaxID=34458 RepID=A0A5K1JT47_9APHY|nr:Uncharacterized protein [Ganoderma boninense]
MLFWVRKNRPPLVILENVCGAPWKQVVTYFVQEGYSADFVKLDTKAFYIPHTRHRKYLLAVNKANSSLPETWKAKIQRLKRPASSTLDAFLLPTDDSESRIHQARQKLANEAADTVSGRRSRTDWVRCESRHQRARLEEHLGAKRPLTGWGEVSCSLSKRPAYYEDLSDSESVGAIGFPAVSVCGWVGEGSASMESKNLQKFQDNGGERVLLLNVMDESVSGANLTSANHVIFLSPLLTTTQEIYDACETQAIGRVRRYSQLKQVNVWRFFSLNTIDVETYEQRTKQRVQ